MKETRHPLEPFVGVAWGVPSVRGLQRAHIVTGATIREAHRTLCGRSSAGAVYPLTSHGRPRVTCDACSRAAAAHIDELPSGETPAERWP